MIKHLIDSVPAGPEPPAESSARILLVEDNAGDARLTQESLATQKVDKFTMVHVASLATACLRLRGEHFDAVLLDLSLPDSHGPATLSSLRQQAPSIPIVVLTGLSDEATAIEAVTQGAQDYLVKGETDGNTLARRLRFAIQRHLSSSTHAVPAEQPKLCKTLGLLGSKGGVGTSTVACYLATALYDLTKEPVLLADFDFDCGVLGFLMEVETKYSLMDALQNADHLEAGIWSTLVSKKAGGLDVIAAPREVNLQEEATPEQYRQVFSFLRGTYRWIIADLGRGLNRHTSDLLDSSDVTCLVTTIELAALRQSRLLIPRLRRARDQTDSLRLVLNEMPKRPPFSPGDIEKMLGCRVWASLPQVEELRENEKQSTSLPRAAALVKGLARMAEEIAGKPGGK
jgi:Flp pilus assembly CpaE family ATPase